MTANDVVTWVQELEADPRYQLEESAATLALEVTEILSHALEARPDIDQKQLSKRLGVTEGRVSQVLNGDGNVHISTIAKYLRALGYELELRPKSVEDGAPSLVRETRRPLSAHVYKTTFADKDGTYEDVRTLITSSPMPRVAMESAKCVASYTLSAKRSYTSEVIVTETRSATAFSEREQVNKTRHLEYTR